MLELIIQFAAGLVLAIGLVEIVFSMEEAENGR